MILRPQELDGAFLVEIEPAEDHRGFYAQSFSEREFSEHGLVGTYVEGGISYNARRGTVRGMHMQLPPHAQAKLVRCTRGAIHDVIIDLRSDSPTHGRWLALDLSASERNALYVPEGFAHGFQTLEDDAEVSYQLSDYHHPEAEFGVRWNDPWFGIEWPIDDVVISDRDRNFDDFRGSLAEPRGNGGRV
jgi:dTDP-4-dehydrorhamnose 3,5-epimerase